MQVAGTIDRIEINPENEEEKAHCQRMINLGRATGNDPLIYWGDSDTFNGALIINTVALRPDYEELLKQAAANSSEPATSAAS